MESASLKIYFYTSYCEFLEEQRCLEFARLCVKTKRYFFTKKGIYNVNNNGIVIVRLQLNAIVFLFVVIINVSKTEFPFYFRICNS